MFCHTRSLSFICTHTYAGAVSKGGGLKQTIGGGRDTICSGISNLCYAYKSTFSSCFGDLALFAMISGYTTIKKFGGGKIFKKMFFKEVYYYSHQGCIHLKKRERERKQ